MTEDLTKMSKLTDRLQSFKEDGCNAPDTFKTLADSLKDFINFLVTEFGTSMRQKLNIQQIQTDIQTLWKTQKLPAKIRQQAQREIRRTTVPTTVDGKQLHKDIRLSQSHPKHNNKKR